MSGAAGSSMTYQLKHTRSENFIIRSGNKLIESGAQLVSVGEIGSVPLQQQ